MLKIIHERNRIRDLQKLLSKKIRSNSDKIIRANVGFHGDSFEDTFYWNKKYDLWAIIERSMKTRYWNAFGFGNPELENSNSIVCEINIPFNVNRRVAGGFAEDNDHNIFLIHRGLIGGSRKGVGKRLFIDNYKGKWADVEDDDLVNRVALVGELESSNIIKQIKDFILEVERIKNLV
ncbi:MAG: hypothetical protein ACOCRO_09645 [Halanaerobiales bacterium]